MNTVIDLASREKDLWSAIEDYKSGSCDHPLVQQYLDRLVTAERLQEAMDVGDERSHWEAEHAALYSAVSRLAATKPGATGRELRRILGAPIDPDADVYVIEGPRGWTAAFNVEQIELLERLGLIRHARDGHVLQDDQGVGVGPLHRYYREAV